MDKNYQKHSCNTLVEKLSAVFYQKPFTTIRDTKYLAVEDDEIEFRMKSFQEPRGMTPNNYFRDVSSPEHDDFRPMERSRAANKLPRSTMKSKQRDVSGGMIAYNGKSNASDLDLTKDKGEQFIYAHEKHKHATRGPSKPLIDEHREMKPKKKKAVALRIGDVVYFKHNLPKNSEISQSEHRKISTVLSGDGIASNKLECIAQDTIFTKNANFLFRKCLFRIETARKYTHAKLYSDVQNTSTPNLKDYQGHEQRLAFHKQKAEEEREENDQDCKNSVGNPVIYGQTIQLRHIYSDTRLTLNNHKLSKQYGCVEFGLEEHGSEYTNFRFLSNDNLRSKEDVVNYSDSLLINSTKDPSMYIQVWSKEEEAKNNTLETGYEINGSEMASNLKINPYMSHEEILEHEKLNDVYLESGDIVKIYHKKTNTVLNVASEDISHCFIEKELRYFQDNMDEKERHQMMFKDLNLVLMQNDNKIHFIDQKQSSLRSLWEIQRYDTFYGGFTNYNELFRIRHVSSGLFLCRRNQELILVEMADSADCYFNFKLKTIDDSVGRIHYNDLLRIQTKLGQKTGENLYLQPSEEKVQETDCYEVKSDVKTAEVTSLYFILKPTTESQSGSANRVASLFAFLTQFYSFLQKWGIARDDGFYKYETALQGEKDLELEVNQLQESLENMNDFLSAENSDYSFKDRQDLLLEQQIVQMLLYIVDLIDIKIYGKRNRPEVNGKLMKVKLIDAGDDWSTSEKTPQYIAHRHLSDTLKEIYKTIEMCARHNTQTSESILKHSSFLSGQLLSYRHEVSVLFRETMRNITRLPDRELAGNSECSGDKLDEWISLLDMISEESNLELQILYLEIISFASMHPNQQTGIRRYQDRVCDVFFSADSPTFLKELVRFRTEDGPDGKPSFYVSFAKGRDLSTEDFYDQNPSLGEFRHEIRDGKGFYSLDEMSSRLHAKRDRYRSIDVVLDYLVAVLRLHHSLCLGRNERAIRTAKQLGLSHDLVYGCMQSEVLHVKLKTAFTHLYEALYIDVAPYKSIVSAVNRCYTWDDIGKKNLGGSTYNWLNVGDNADDGYLAENKENIGSLLRFIVDFWTDGGSMKIKQSDQREEMYYKLRHLKAMLSLTRNVVLFGLTNRKMNDVILYAVLHVFYLPNSEYIKSEHWLTKFIGAIKNQNSIQLTKRLEYTYDTAISILQVLLSLRLNLQVQYTLKAFKKAFSNQEKLPNKQLFQQFYNELFKLHGLNATRADAQKSSLLLDVEDNVANSMHLDSISQNSDHPMSKELVGTIIDELPAGHRPGQKASKDPVMGTFVLLQFLFDIAESNTAIEKKVVEVIDGFLNQRDELLQELMQVEVIVADPERALMKQIMLPVDSSEEQLLSVAQFHIEVDQYLYEDQMLAQAPEIYLESHIRCMKSLKDKLKSLNDMYKVNKKEPRLFRKMQNIVRNLSMLSSVTKLFTVKSKDKEQDASKLRHLQQIAVKFLTRSASNNRSNQKKLVPCVSQLMELIPYGVSVAKLIATIFSEIKQSEMSNKLICKVLAILGETKQEAPPSTHTQYLKILRSLVVDHHRVPIRENQKKIMPQLMKNLMNPAKRTFDAKSYERRGAESKGSDKESTEIAHINFQAEVYLLLANLCLNSKLTMMQAKKVLSLDQCKNRLSSESENTPFIIKKGLLRCLFQIYIFQHEDVNADFELRNLTEVFGSVVIPDLAAFSRYIEGLLMLKSKGAEKMNERSRKKRVSGLSANIVRANQRQGRDVADRSTGRLVNDASEYWEYLCSGNSWDLSRDGLLYFVLDCLKLIRSGKWLDEDSLSDTLNLVRAQLLNLEKLLKDVDTDVNVDEFKILVKECIRNTQHKSITKIGKAIHMVNGEEIVDREEIQQVDNQLSRSLDDSQDNIKDKSTRAILKHVLSFITDKKISLRDFYLMIAEDDDAIERAKLKEKLQLKFGEDAQYAIAEFVDQIDRINTPSKQDLVSIKYGVLEFLEKHIEPETTPKYNNDMKEKALNNFLNYEFKIKQISNECDFGSSIAISSFYSKFVEHYHTYCVDSQDNQELKEYTNKLYERVHCCLEGGMVDELRAFIIKLKKAFRRKQHNKIFLLSLRGLLSKYDYQIAPDTSESSLLADDTKLKKLQVVLDKAKVSHLCLSFFLEETGPELIAIGTDVLILMLEKGNRDVQISILRQLKQGGLGFSFLNYIKSQLWSYIANYNEVKRVREDRPEGIDAIPDATLNEKILQQKIIIDLIKLTQLFCENVFSDFQNFLREQTYDTEKTGRVSINIINEIAIFLITLHQTDDDLLTDDIALNIVEQAIETLTDTCLGPCQENQALLGKQKHLLNFINVIMRTNIDFSNHNEYKKAEGESTNELDINARPNLTDEERYAKENRERLEVFNITTKLLLSIFQGNKNEQVKAYILKYLEIQSIINKLLDIFRQQVANKTNDYYYQEKMSEQELIVLETGFDLYIFLTIMKEEFPDEDISKRFSIVKLTPAQAKIYRSLQRDSKDSNEKSHRPFKTTSHKNKIHDSGSPTNRRLSERNLTRKAVLSVHEKESERNLLLDDDKSSAAGMNRNDSINNTFQLDGKTFRDRDKSSSPVHLYKTEMPGFFSTHKGVNALIAATQTDVKVNSEKQEVRDQEDLNKTIHFFKRFVQSVEIMNEEEETTKQYFQVPFVCNFVTQNIRYNLIYEANRNSDAERLEHLVFNQDKYLKEMEHRQHLARNKVLDWFVRNWRMFKDIAFVFVFANNIIILMTFEQSKGIGLDTTNMPQWSRVANDILSFVQVILALIALVFCKIERYPISIYKSKRQLLGSQKASRELKKELAIEQNSTSLYKAIRDGINNYYYGPAFDNTDKNEEPRFFRRAWRVLKDRQNFYNLTYFLFSMLAALVHPLFYSVLLLDLVKRSDDLQNIIKSITLNLNQLFKTSLLGAIVMYFYAILGYLYFNNDYPNADNAEDPEQNLYCSSLVLCLASVINSGLRAGGGVGEMMEQRTIDDDKFWGRYLYDFTFFVFCIIILLNIIFGLIIDTFAELRDMKKERDRDICGKCFICGHDKYEFDTKGNGWYEHIYREHNVYAYLNYMIFIQKKNINDCNAMEKRVKEQIKKSDIGFLPLGTAIALPDSS